MNKQHTRPVRRVLAVILSLALLLTFTPLSGVVTLSASAEEEYTHLSENTRSVSGTVGVFTDIAISHWIELSGDTILYIESGCTLNIGGGGIIVGRGHDLTICGEGTIEGYPTSSGIIGVNNIVIESGKIKWQSVSGSTIKATNVTVNGGNIWLESTQRYGIEATNAINLNGGIIHANKYSADHIYINGLEVQASQINNKTLQLGYKTITWQNYDGSTLKTEQVNYGETPSYSGETPTKASDGKYNYTFSGWSPAITTVSGNVTYTAEFTKTPIATHFSQEGDSYTIHNDTGWDIFCDCLDDNDTYNRFSGKTVVLADDITVTRMASGADHDFKGIFDGQGHTLTVAYGTADSPVSDDDKAAPFRNVESGCVIKNLHTQGTIYTSKKYAGGIVGTQYGTVRLENCRSSVTINSMTAGDGTHGGLVGRNGSSSSAKLTIDGCVFDGKILSVGDDPTTNCAGFVGYKGNNATITNSIYAPKALEADETEPAGNSATFVRNGSAGANCYYTRTLGTAQGKQAYTITAGDDVTLGLAGEATEYGVSGITAYADSNGIKYGETTLCAGSGDTVTLTVAPSAVGYAVNSVSVNDGAVAVTSNENGTYSFTMPASNAAVTAELEEASYFDASTGTLTLKGNVLNSVAGIVLPDGVNNADVRHINVDSSGATLPENSARLFQNFTNVKSIDLTGADTSGVRSMNYMFYYCTKLTELDLSSFDTSRVEDMNHMFSVCGGLTELDLSNFDTSSVMDMNNMFYNCASLETLDLSSFDTSCVEDMSGMFIACVNLTELDLSSFDTSSVTNMEHMFECCDFLKKLDLSSFDTSFVNSMTNMFYGCEHLTELNLSSFDTRYVTNMSSMFSDCDNLTTIYVSEQWSTDRVYNSNDMFEYCRSLKGGNGTAYDGSKTNREYARIDKDGQPGYLTGTYAVTVPAGITISPVNAIIDSVPFCVKGETITISPGEGYIIADAFVFIDIGYDIIEIEITDNNDGTYSFTMPESEVSMEVETAFSDGVGAALAGHSISLEGDIAVNFYMDLDPEIAQSETAYMQFTIPNGSKSETKTVFVKDAREDGGYYIFKCSVAAKDMSSEISAQLIDGDNTSTVYTYSVKDYADWLIEHKNDSAAYTKAAPLVEKMLRYGAYAKEYFDKTNTLPDLGDVNIDSQFDTYTSTVSDDLFDGATLSLKSQTTLSLYFTDEDELTFTCVDENGAERTVETVRNGSTQIARIRNIAAKELKNSFTVTVKRGETELGTITYSPMNYCYKALNGGTENKNLINAVKALVAYSDAANEYFKAGV
nr:BspA family leucine-rich repeat surface protein [uncultured Ruminococcus sp.]